MCEVRIIEDLLLSIAPSQMHWLIGADILYNDKRTVPVTLRERRISESSYFYVSYRSEGVSRYAGRCRNTLAGGINVVMGLVGNAFTVSRLEDLGVKRVSIGGSLARAILG